MKKHEQGEFVIPFVGLKVGHHLFDFSLTDSFFEDVDYATIAGGTIQVNLDLEKKETMMIGNFSCSGTIQASCYRCNEQVNMPIEASFKLIFKLGNDHSDDESLVILPPHAYQIDVKPYIYELIVVSLPLRIVHTEQECDSEAIEALKRYVIN